MRGVGLVYAGTVGAAGQLTEPERVIGVFHPSVEPAAHLVETALADSKERPLPSLGHVTAAIDSPNLGHPIALALLRDGRARYGETLVALSPVTGERTAVTVTGPVFFDPEGERVRA